MISVRRADLSLFPVDTVVLVDTEDMTYKLILEMDVYDNDLRAVVISRLDGDEEENEIGTFLLNTIQVGKAIHAVGIPNFGNDNVVKLGEGFTSPVVTAIEIYSTPEAEEAEISACAA